MSFLNWQGIYVGTKDEGIETEIFNIGNKDIRGCIACGRCGGTTASFDVVNKFFTISGMPVASSQYWNNIHGGAAGEAAQDADGLPEKEEHAWTNFI